MKGGGKLHPFACGHYDPTKKDLWNDVFGERFKRIEALWVLLAIMVSPAGIPPIRPTVIICRWAGLLRAHQSPFVSSFLCDSSHHTLTYSHACTTDDSTSDQEKEHPLPMLIFPMKFSLKTLPDAFGCSFPTAFHGYVAHLRYGRCLYSLAVCAQGTSCSLRLKFYNAWHIQIV